MFLIYSGKLSILTFVKTNLFFCFKSLADFLQNRSSVQVGRNGGLGGVTSFFLRGAESRNVLILLNGVRLRDELTQSSLAENIPLDLVEKIEVIPGNLSSVYG